MLYLKGGDRIDVLITVADICACCSTRATFSIYREDCFIYGIRFVSRRRVEQRFSAGPQGEAFGPNNRTQFDEESVFQKAKNQP
ncbi:TPA: hypothetical protein JD349_16085 [Serratia marcescens]|nr:hypothetical protein [Serratia marcescens]